MLAALSLVLVAFGHQPVRPANAGETLVAAYVLPDGTVSVLCIGGEDDTGGGSHSASTICGACLLTAAAGLCHPPADSLPDAGLSRHPASFPKADAPADRAFPPSAPPTAPPLA